MNLDKEFVSAVLRGGKDAFLACLDRGIDAEVHLADDGQEAWKYVLEHWNQYGELPVPEIVVRKVKCDLTSQSDSTFEFFLDELLKRRKARLCHEVCAKITDKLDARDPDGAGDALAEIHHKIQNENLSVKKIESLLSLGKEVIKAYDDAKAGVRGIPTPWPSMDDQTLGWWPEDLVLFVGRLGVGKCNAHYTLIQDAVTGVQRTIEDVYNNPDSAMVTTWSKEKGIHPAEITAKVDTGHKECLKFTLGTGRSIDVTPEHPFMTPDGWRRADEVTAGSSLAIPMTMPFPGKPKAMKDAEVDLMAILLADGSVTHGHTGFTKSDSEIIRIATEAADTLGAEVVSRGVDYQHYIRGSGLPGGNPVLELLREHGVSGKKSVDKTIPDAIFRLDKEQLARFLTVFWMCDGYVDGRGPAIVLSSRKMLEQIQSLLLRFGVQSRLADKPSKCNGKTFAAWRLRVYSFCQEKFLEEFNLWGDRRANLEELLTKKPNSNVGFPRISKELRKEIEVLARSRSYGRWSESLLKEVGVRLGWKSKFMTRNLFGQGDSLLLGRFKVFCEVYGCEHKYKWLWDSGLHWDTVESIESVGEQKIYDLTVAPTSCFVANDILVHNTWVTLIVLHEAWKADKKVLLISTEMNKLRLAMRFFALNLRMPYDDIRRGRLGEFVEEKFYAGVKELISQEGLDIVSGDYDYTIDNIEASIDANKPDILGVDGPYLIKNEGKDRHERVSNTFDDFKRMARRHQHVTITNLQFNRSAKTGQGNTISAENIGITDVAGWNADVVYGLLQTEDMRNDWEMGIKALKIREGKPDEFKIRWNHKDMDFSEIVADSDDDDDGSTGSSSGSKLPDDDYEDVPF